MLAPLRGVCDRIGVCEEVVVCMVYMYASNL